MNLKDKASDYRQQAIRAYQKAESYRQIGLVRIADDYEDMARQFTAMADYIHETPLLDKQVAS